MLGSNYYHRSFIILHSKDLGFGLSGTKAPGGYCKIEIKRNRGKIHVYVQDLKPMEDSEGVYDIVLISIDREIESNKLASIKVDERGRGEYSVEFDANNVADSGHPLDDFHALAVVFRPLTLTHSQSIRYPLVGYANKRIQVDWEGRVRQGLAKLYALKSETMAELPPQGAKPAVAAQEEPVGDVMLEGAGEAAGNELDVQSMEDGQDEPDAQSEEYEEDMSDTQSVEDGEDVEGLEKDQDDHDVQQYRKDVREEHHERAEEVQGMEIVSDEPAEDAIHEAMQEAVQEAAAVEDKQVEAAGNELDEQSVEDDPDEQSIEDDMDEQSIEDELGAQGAEDEEDMLDAQSMEDDLDAQSAEDAEGLMQEAMEDGQTYWSKVKGYFDSLFRSHRLVCPFDDVFGEAEWIQVQQIGSAYMNGYMGAPYHGQHYSGYTGSSHYLVGLIRKNNKVRYVAYGIPSYYNMLPPMGLYGFSRWLPVNNGYGMGYWLLYIDANTGCIAYPQEF